jgi:hypothetical protein
VVAPLAARQNAVMSPPRTQFGVGALLLAMVLAALILGVANRMPMLATFLLCLYLGVGLLSLLGGFAVMAVYEPDSSFRLTTTLVAWAALVCVLLWAATVLLAGL